KGPIHIHVQRDYKVNAYTHLQAYPATRLGLCSLGVASKTNSEHRRYCRCHRVEHERRSVKKGDCRCLEHLFLLARRGASRRTADLRPVLAMTRRCSPLRSLP
ncbi:hypothetical protein C0J52_17787, partial [Blattella germanica]